MEQYLDTRPYVLDSSALPFAQLGRLASLEQEFQL
jgi:hypothetical protein